MKKQPEITFSEIDPVAAETACDIPVDNTKNITFSIKSTREKVIAAIENHAKLSSVDKASLLARVRAVPLTTELIALDCCGHPHKGGYNARFTVSAVS